MAGKLIGTLAIELFSTEGRVRPEFRDIEFPLMDWLGNILEKPVYELYSNKTLNSGGSLTAPCYDTSLYFDKLHHSCGA
jgi:L-rhamnonate dehydratase